jgi:hypothetical protein
MPHIALEMLSQFHVKFPFLVAFQCEDKKSIGVMVRSKATFPRKFVPLTFDFALLQSMVPDLRDPIQSVETIDGYISLRDGAIFGREF